MKKIVIIGNGIAGISAASEIRKNDTDCDIKMISKEHVPGYNRPMLTKNIFNEIDEKIFYIKPAKWYTDNNIDLLLDTKVETIDTVSKTIKLIGDKYLDYDKLILAMGAEANEPPIPGKELKGVFSIRSLKDIESIRDHATDSMKAIVIGGGVLGLEAAWDLKNKINDVKVLERSDSMMSRQLDKTGSRLLKNAADKAGIDVVFGADTQEIVGNNGKVTAVKLKSGETIDADLIILSMGIKRNIEIAKDAGLATGRGIVVNDDMTTSDKDVFAAGDCAEYDGITYGIWPEGMEMGKIAGANAVGGNLKYKQITPANAFNVKDVSLYSIGDTGKNNDVDYDEYEFIDEDKGIYEKYYFADDFLTGGILMGDMSKITKLMNGFKNKEQKNEFLK